MKILKSIFKPSRVCDHCKKILKENEDWKIEFNTAEGASSMIVCEECSIVWKEISELIEERNQIGDLYE